jgi:hypothetical protein
MRDNNYKINDFAKPPDSIVVGSSNEHIIKHYRLNSAVIQKVLSHPAAGQRGEDAAEAKNGEDDEDCVHAGDEGCVVRRCDLDVADKNTEYQHYHTHTEGHANLPHGG